MIKKSLERIQGIASSLLSIKESGYGDIELANIQDHKEEQTSETLQLANLITHIVQEKKLSSAFTESVDLRLLLPGNSGYGSFIHGSRKDIQTVISNVLNNAVEGLGVKRGIVCELAEDQRFHILSITDKGKGIPEDILPRIFARGFTHDKKNGNGLGLFHARTVLESIGGSIHITSKVGSGTNVILKFPKVTPPPWFMSKIILTQGTTFVICDDDLTVHEMWQDRLQKTGFDLSQVINFYNLGSFKSWWQIQKKKSKHATNLFLIDHDFRGENMSGLDMIKSLGLSWQSCLVTNRFETFTDEQYNEFGQLALIVKDDLAKIPLEYFENESFRGCILIEDDDFVREAWEFEAREQGTELMTCSHPRDILMSRHRFPNTTPIFIDSELGYGIKGEIFAKQLHDLGYTRLIMTTGHPASYFAEFSLLHAVIKKEPPSFDEYLRNIN